MGQGPSSICSLRCLALAVRFAGHPESTGQSIRASTGLTKLWPDTRLNRTKFPWPREFDPQMVVHLHVASLRRSTSSWCPALVVACQIMLLVVA